MPVTLWRRPWTHNAIYVRHQAYRQLRRYTPDKIREVRLEYQGVFEM